MKKNLLLTLTLLASSIIALGQIAFTPGNMVVAKVGNGTALVATYGPVVLEEYALNGLRNQTIPLTNVTVGYNQQTEAGLNLSSNGNNVTLFGSLGTTGNATAPASVDKVAATVNQSGVASYVTVPFGSFSVVPRNAVRNDGDGTFYATGTSAGVRLISADGSTVTQLISGGSSTAPITSSAMNTKGIDIKNGNLYLAPFNAALAIRMYTGLPTTAAALAPALPGMATTSTGSHGFLLLDRDGTASSVDVMYYLEGSGVIRKYSLVSGSWVDNGTITINTVSAITVTNGGTGYSNTPTITIGGTGTGATATATVVGGVVTKILLTNLGLGYTGTPTVTITDATGTGATATATAVAATYGISGALIGNTTVTGLLVTAGNNTSNNSLLLIRDVSGHNQAFSAATTTVSTVAMSGENYVFRGVSTTPGTTTLPVSLTSFTGKKTLNGNQLNWATASEINNQRFDILRSSDKDNFQVISSVTGKNKAAQYNYLDAAPAAGYNYYKLNQVDFDGTVTTHDKVVAINSDLSDAESTIFVSNGTLTYSINSNVAANTSLQIFDMNGRKLLSTDLNLKAGLTMGNFSVQSLINGVYVANLMVNGKALAIKFVK